MEHEKPVIKEILKADHAFVQMVFDFRVILSYQHKREPDLSIDNAAAEAIGLIESGKTVYGMYLAEELIGFGCVAKKKSQADKRIKEYWLEALFIRSELRRRGYGSLLFDHASKQAKKAGGDGLRVPVFEENSEMIAFMSKQNYTSNAVQE